ncbi:hypothetical protein QUF80_12150, partial [Desulfococcaceae bacterium HSG8]|nr:hypothetical protein [Desulfococcaceae bacterium HSG8]
MAQTFFHFENMTGSDAPCQKSEMLQNLPDPDLFDGLSEKEAYGWREYLYATPRKKTRKLSLRNHVIALYDPFASRKDFPAGRRWCVNVYVGCIFSCKYCYIVSYIRNAFKPHSKKNFKKLAERDIKKIQKLGLHPAPIHISNSTDPLQYLEKSHKHTLFLLQKLREHRECFTTITVLTKNPMILCDPEYLTIIQALKNFQVEVTCPFYKDDIRKFFEPYAPPIESRLEAIRKLREKDITISLRLDPVLPRVPLPKEFFSKPGLEDYDAPEGQTDKDIEQLIRFASEVGCKSIIVSPLKLVIGRFGNPDICSDYLKLYTEANQGKLIRQGSAYRMPWPLYLHWLEKPGDLAKSLGIPLIYCKNNLLNTY